MSTMATVLNEMRGVCDICLEPADKKYIVRSNEGLVLWAMRGCDRHGAKSIESIYMEA